MKFIYADSLDFVDPKFDFKNDRSKPGRVVQRDDEYPHEFLGTAPYDGVLVSRSIVGDHMVAGKYTQAQAMRFHRDGARAFLRYLEKDYPNSLLFGDCGAFTYRNDPTPPYTPADTVDFYGDAGFTHGCSVDHLIFDFDDGEGRPRKAVPSEVLARYDLTLDLAADFFSASKSLGKKFTPLGVIQGWSAPSMGEAAKKLTKMGYRYLAVGGLVPLREVQIHRALAAIREVIPKSIKLHLLGFGKIETLSDYAQYGVASFDTTSPLLRAFKDAQKNYFARSNRGEMSYYTAIRVPQAITNAKLVRQSREGALHQEETVAREQTALDALRDYDRKAIGLEPTLEAVMAYWDALNWTGEEETSASRAKAIKQRFQYARTLGDRPWTQCQCRTCAESSIEAVIFRSSNRNKRRGIHNLHVFYEHLKASRVTE